MDIIGQQQDGTWGYFGYDALGSVRQMTDSTGAVSYAANYDPYGTIFESNGVAASLGFTGDMVDPTGLLYLRARYVDVATGTFLTRDPVWGVAGLSVTYNPYLYVHGNPINLTDPSGKFPFVIGMMIAGFLIGGGLDLFSQFNSGKNWQCIDWGSVLLAAGLGSIAGLVMTFGSPYAWGSAISAALYMTFLIGGNLVDTAINHRRLSIRELFNGFSTSDLAINMITGGILNGLSSAIIAKMGGGFGIPFNKAFIFQNGIIVGGEIGWINIATPAWLNKIMALATLGMSTNYINHLLTDDNPFESNDEFVAVTVGGAANGIVPLGPQEGIRSRECKIVCVNGVPE